MAAAVEALCAELGGAPAEEPPYGADPPARLRSALSRLALAVQPGKLSKSDEFVLRAALDGAEHMVRTEAGLGRAEPPEERLQSFVFLVVLPVVGRRRALELSRRAGRIWADSEPA